MLLVLDIDWIFTDWKHYYSKDGKMLKSFWSNDRFILNLVRQIWLFDNIFCLTWDWTEKWMEISKARVEKELQIDVICIKEFWAMTKYEFLIQKYWTEQFIRDNVIYIWDDFVDLRLIKNCKWSATTANAHKLVKKYCNFVSDYSWWDWWLADILIEYMVQQDVDVEALLLNL